MILLTGGAGFIGSCLLNKLNNEGIEDILLVDNLSNSSKWKNLIGKKYTAYENKDIFIDKLQFGEFDNKIEYIFHLGACSSTTETDIDYLMYNNFNFSKEIAEFALSNNIGMMYASSAATYGNGEFGYSDTNFDNLRPLNGYGYSKHIFDQWVISQGYESRLTGFKYFNVFGPNEYHKDAMSSMVFKSFNQIKEMSKVNLFKSNDSQYVDGGQKRDFIYVKDVVDVMWKSYQNSIYGIYNLGTGKARDWNSLVKAVFNALDKEVKIEYIDMPDNLKRQYQNFTEADMTKLNKNIKHNFMLLEDSINDYVKNYLSNSQPYF